MKVGICLLLGLVLLLFVVESVYNPARSTRHVYDVRNLPYVDGDDLKSKNNFVGINNNKDPFDNEALDYEKNRERLRRSIKKKLADHALPQNEQRTTLEAEKVLQLASEKVAVENKHRIRHHHGRKFRKDRIVLLNTTMNDPRFDKLKTRYKFVSDYGNQTERRKRYSYITKDGVVHYTYKPVVGCSGWAYYNPYRCVPCHCTREACVRPCENVGPRTFPAPYVPQQPSQGHKPETGHADYGTTTYKPPPPIYSGVGKYWVGPRLGCNCNPRGSEISTCDIKTGQCRCKPFYIGRTCDRCQDGFWENADGCIKCNCDLDGSKSDVCNQRTGQCNCKPGIGGKQCNTCLPNYYGFSSQGCRACETCNKKGHMCDPDTGRCVCPPYSHGEYCHLCSINAWGYEPGKGCKVCNCSKAGSLKMQCNLNTGECSCRLGYIGFNCERCAYGYFGYPRCRRCNCNFAGTDRYKAKCDRNGICQCDENGICPCKVNVVGKRCDVCKDGTFGLHLENPDGCTQCFCFGRSSKCSESGLTWGQIRTNSSRTLTLTSSLNNKVEISEKLLVIPGIHGNVSIENYNLISPLYWRLHPVFNGDRILSYGGYLRFISHTHDARRRLPQEVLNHHPLVQLRGHNKIVLEYYPPLPSKSNRHEVRLHESLWKRIYPKETSLSPRELLMIALQNVQNIFIKASDSSLFDTITLQEVILDTAIQVLGNPPPLAKGVEMCECPRQYNSSSCQNPSIGFFRYYTPPSSVNGTILIDTYVGQAKPCECNGRSNVCDTETGYCLKCNANTDGRYCEVCTEGYFGNPMSPFGKCEPCPCPSPTQNFAKECEQMSTTNQFVCKCKLGYSGSKCDQCSFGYYGQPQIPGGNCQPCNCNVEGKISDECDAETGQCNCKPGIVGKDCSYCEKPRHVLMQYKCTPCDQCTQWLLDDVEFLSSLLYLNTNFLVNGTLEPPWESLKTIENQYGYLNDKLATYLNEKALAEQVIANSDIDDLEVRVNELKRKVKKQNPDEILEKGKNILKGIHDVNSEIRESKVRLENLIETLKNFGQSHLSTKEALKQARSLMRQIDNIAKNMKYPNTEVLQKCKHVNELINKMMSKPIIDPKDLKTSLSKLNNNMKDLEKIITKIELKINEVDLRNVANKIRIKQLMDLVNDMKNKSNNADVELTETKKIIEKVFRTLDDLQQINDRIALDPEFSDLLKKLKNKVDDLTRFDANEIMDPVFEHVRQLENNATEFTKLFNLSSKEINAIKASEAYGNIKKFIDEAKASADEALSEINNALNTLSPEGKDSIAVNTSISLADSERLAIRVQHQRENLAEIKQRKDILALQVNTLDSNNWNNGLKNREQDTLLRDIKKSLSESNKKNIERLINKLIEEMNKMKDIHRKAMNLEITKQYELVKPYQRLLNLTTSIERKKLQEQINVTKEELRNVFDQKHTYLDIIKENNAKFLQFKAKNNSIALKLQELKAKIENAKKTAEGIRISLTGTTCSRAYMLSNLSPTLVTKLVIKFNYTIHTEPDNSNSLFYLNTSSDQFMNLKIIENNLQFEWKLGQKINKIEHQLVQNDFYTVEINRIGEFAEMLITNKETRVIKQEFKGEKSENDTVIFKASPSNFLNIGYSPNTQPGIPNCIRDVIYDDYKLGLWNFHTSQGQCYGCIRNNELSLEPTYDFYKGDGYAFISKDQQERYANPSKFNVQFSLTTFDENALLFLAVDPERKNYIAITLKDGYIQYEVHYPNREDIIMKTEQKYNNGEKVRVLAEKAWRKSERQDIAMLKIGDNRTALTETRKNIDSSALLRLKKTNYYFGGVPPGYFLDSAGATASLHTHQSLLGGLEELREYQPFNDDNIKKFGVTKQSGELAFRKAWFEGLGYLQLKTKPLESKFLFLLRTKDGNAFIMYIEDMALLTIHDGKLKVKFSILENDYYLNSEHSINDDEYHLIELLRHKKKIVLKINGLIEDSVKIKESAAVSKQDSTIYIGGVPQKLSALLEGSTLFSGGIGDILIDNKLVKFNKHSVQNFVKVKIGRDELQQMKIPTNLQQPDIAKVPTDGLKEMQSTEGCGKPLNYTLDPNAAKFGDKQHSHVLHYLRDSFWKKDFTLEIAFRTLQPNGMLLLSYGFKQHFNLLEIQGGKIVFKMNGKRQKEIKLPQKIDDGNWYTILIEATGVKKKRKLTVAINGYKTKPIRPPKNKVTRELYIGGISQNVTLPSVIRTSLEPFRGCIRGLKINKTPQSLVRDKNTIHHNIGQCFPSIEKGSYFGGDAYAIYKKYFQIEKILELSLEFRTTEQNGILLSISNPRNSPALSVELQDGAIVMTTDNGYGSITNVTNNLSDFALCNNQWHNVTAVYTSTEITINVDGIRKIWVQPDDETLMDELEAPLYIGGLPDYAPVGTLKMKENFKGCIKNMKIGNAIIDFINMEKVTNVLLDSCPMVS